MRWNLTVQIWLALREVSAPRSKDSSSSYLVSPSRLNFLARICYDRSIYLLIPATIKLCFFTHRNVCCSAAFHNMQSRLVQLSRTFLTLCTHIWISSSYFCNVTMTISINGIRANVLNAPKLAYIVIGPV